MKTKFKLSNRILSLVLAIVMVVGLLPMTAVPAHAATESPCSGDHTGWTELNTNTTNTYIITSGGKYYLGKSLSTDESRVTLKIQCTEEVTLCLNGKTLSHKGNYYKDTIWVDKGSILNVCDCTGNGSIESTDSGIYIDENGTCNMYGGTIKNCYKPNGYGSAVDLNPNATFNMYGGTITGCKNGNNDGGAIGTYWDTAEINLYGGNITGNNKYGVYTNGGPVCVSGDVKITGNTLGDIYIPRGKTISVGTLTEGADIGVTSGSGGNDIAITGTNAVDYSQYFHADNSNYQILNKDSVLYLHKHSYSEATCVAPKTCSCGSTEGSVDATNHNISTEWTTSNGTHYKECLNGCGMKLEEGTCSGGIATCANKAICTTCQNEYGSTSGHSLQYSASDNVITETCKNNCGHSETATLSLDTTVSLNYTGSEIKPLEVEYSEGWQGETLDIAYQNNTSVSTDVSKASGSITKNDATATLSFTITKGTMSGISVNGYSGVYDGEEHGISITNVPADATVSYSTSENGTYTSTNPTYRDKGSYTVWYKIEKENYEIVSGSVDVVISPAKLTVKADDISKTYGESDPTLTWQITEGRLAGADALQNISISRVDGKDADSYAITVSQTEDSNPNYDITFEGGTFTIYQKEIGISWGATEFIPYTGELIVPQATATGLESGDVCTLTTSVVETTEGAGIVPGRWHAKVTSLSNDNYCLPASGNLVEVEYGIVKGYIAAPVVSGIDETVKGKADGKINGLTTTMEYATEYTADDDKYTKVTDANMTFAAGTYYVRYQAAGYYNASPFTEVTIKDGGLLNVSVPATQTGYTLTVADTKLVWNGSTTLTFALANGYSATDAFAVKVNGDKVELDANGKYVITNAQENITVTVEGVADTTVPTAEIKVKDNSWTEFLKNITFGLFFKETQDVTITATDKGSGIKSIEYYLAHYELGSDELEAMANWTEYNGTFKIDPNNRYVIYAKVTDNAGNITYVNSDGIILDNVAPTLEGIENGKTYYGDLTVIKSDEQFYDIKMVTLDGEPMGFEEGTYGLIPADNAEHTIIVEDHAGNKTTYTVTVMKNYTVTFKADGVTVDTQTVGYGKDATVPTIPTKDGYTQTAPTWDKDGKNITADTEINAVYTINKYTVTYKADGEVVGTVTVEHGKDATAPTIPEKEGYTQTAPTWDKDGKNITADIEINAVYTINKYTVTYKADGEVVSTVEVEHGGDVEAPAVPAKSGYVGKWDAVGKDITKDTTISAVYTAILDVKADEVKPEDKTELEDTKKQLEEMLDDDSYTEDDKKDIQDAIDNIDEALEVIGNVENVEELIDKLPDTIKKDDEPAIKAADDAYNALSDYEKSLVDEDAKKALDDAKAALAELNKPADPNSPQTGDNSNMFLWIALLFISGGALITLTVVDRKRRTASKR